MQRLLIVRHGIAVPHGTPDIPDDERPLTAKGERRARQVARGLARLGVAPDRIATSPLPRARRTAEILAEVLGLGEAIEDVDALRAENSAERIRDWLGPRSEPVLMIVGHNPALSELVGLLVMERSSPPLCELGKAGVAALTRHEDGSHRLDWLATARMVRRYD